MSEPVEWDHITEDTRFSPSLMKNLCWFETSASKQSFGVQYKLNETNFFHYLGLESIWERHDILLMLIGRLSASIFW